MELMPADAARSEIANRHSIARRVAFGIAGLALGGLFLYLALRNIRRQDFEPVLQRFDRSCLAIGVAVYMGAIDVRSLRWGVLLRTNESVKWRHAVEALLDGEAEN